ncbi:MAG: TonB family protein [Lysobacter spongiicola]|nr:TonB family protein [Lysobacter spongiicola]
MDRAAVNAVLRWRFEPATANGQPTVGTVEVPIEFNPRR